MVASSIPYSSQKNGKRSRTIKPCVSHHITGIWFCSASSTSLLLTIVYYFEMTLTMFVLMQN